MRPEAQSRIGSGSKTKRVRPKRKNGGRNTKHKGLHQRENAAHPLPEKAREPALLERVQAGTALAGLDNGGGVSNSASHRADGPSLPTAESSRSFRPGT